MPKVASCSQALPSVGGLQVVQVIAHFPAHGCASHGRAFARSPVISRHARLELGNLRTAQHLLKSPQPFNSNDSMVLQERRPQRTLLVSVAFGGGLRHAM